MVLYCSQEKETGALQTTVLKKKETGALLLMFSGEGDWCSTVLWRRAMGLNLSVFIGFIYIKPKYVSVYLDKRFHTDNG